MKKSIKSTILAAALAAGSLLGGTEQRSSRQCLDQNALEVRTAEIKYAQSPLVSHDFNGCSAIILDSGNRALMAHALPTDTISFRGERWIGADTAIDDLLVEAGKYNIDPKTSKIYVIFGKYSPKGRIMKSVKDHNLSIEKVIDSEINCRSVYYDPQTNQIVVDGAESARMLKLRKNNSSKYQPF